MKNKHVASWMTGAAITVAATVAGWSQMAATAQESSKGIAWESSMQQAQQTAKRTGKPILVKFHATWCSVCTQLNSKTLTKPAVVAESKKWVSVQVDVDKSPDLAEKYGVTGLPTVAFLRPDGSLATSFVGFREAGEAVKIMQAARVTATSSKSAAPTSQIAKPVASQPSCCPHNAKP